MASTDPHDLDGLAGEYVLGTLSAEERLVAEQRLGTDAAFRAAVAAWEARLQPLADAGTLEPSHHLFERIVAALPEDRGGNVVALRKSRQRWRAGAILSGAVAAALLAFVVVDRTVLPREGTRYVATLTTDGKAPAFVLTVDTASNTLTVRRVTTAAPDDKSYELWAVPAGGSPESLGVIENASLTRTLPNQPTDLVFAVSLEPKGGSPTGTPGEVVFHGPLVREN